MDTKDNEPHINIYEVFEKEGIKPWTVTPNKDVFDEMISCSIKVWETNYTDEHGYVTEKVSRLQSLTNVEDNAMICYRMFDHNNQKKLIALLGPEAIAYVQFNDHSLNFQCL